MPNVNIALSLHSAFEEKRNIIIPINQRYPLKDVIACLDTLSLRKKQFVTYEYLLLKNFNDSEEDAVAVGELLKGKKALINLIPFNPFPGAEFRRSPREAIRRFSESLNAAGIVTTTRKTRGDDIDAACGQLAGLVQDRTRRLIRMEAAT